MRSTSLRRLRGLRAAGVWTLLALTSAVFAGIVEYQSGVVWPKPKLVAPGPPGGVPSDAVVLFDGKDLSQWQGGEKWIVRDGCAIADQQSITSKQSFGDCQLHVEWATPEVVSGSGQGRGNSGVFLMGKYEVQILDSYGNDTYYDGQAGAVYKQHPPLVNACRKPGQWQAYDIVFTAPRFDHAGKLAQPAYVTILHNGVLVQNHFELTGDTSYVRAPLYAAHPPRLPLELQYHNNPVRFRNIWIREIRPLEPIAQAGKPEKGKPAKAQSGKPQSDPRQPKSDQHPAL